MLDFTHVNKFSMIIRRGKAAAGYRLTQALALVAAIILAALAPRAYAVPIAPVADYQFQNGGNRLASTVAGAPDLTTRVGTTGSTYTPGVSNQVIGGNPRDVLDFNADQGFNMNIASVLSNTGTYTIAMNYRFTGSFPPNSYKELINFSDNNLGDGLFQSSVSETLTMAPNWSTFGPTSVPNNGAFQHLVLTRDNSTGNVNVYLNNNLELAFTATSNPGASVAGTLNNVYFFLDDAAEEHQGQIASISIYNAALTAQEVADLAQFFVEPLPPAPEPSTGLMLILGALGMVTKIRRHENARFLDISPNN